MSASTTYGERDDETLRGRDRNHLQDDSICTDEFEIISCDTLASLADSDGTLENVIRSQSETREILEKAIISLDTINRERSEIASKFETLNNLEEEIKSLKGRVADLERENADLRKANAEKEAVVESSLNQEGSSVKDDELLKKQIANLEQQLYDRGLEVDKRAKALTKATVELEAAYRKIGDLTESCNSAEAKCKELSAKVDETFALLLSEREHSSVVEDEIRSLRADGGNGFNFSRVSEQMLVREMQEKASYTKKLEVEIENLRKQLEDQIKRCNRKDDELSTHVEIINVLKEEDSEGRRQIAEKNRKIQDLEEMVQQMFLDRADIENLRKQLEDQIKRCNRKDDELSTHVEIINVLKEEDSEGRRQIAEKNRKIQDLEEMVQQMFLDRADVNNC
ncbi:unnamed protein product [Heligmosomoides polygyrus]|uniref:Myosin tail domain-containing protein n=1 Tax=Heligmosomoides polygyrus TaxID=6339 RepID=A0A3P8BWS6_HELPZ|nr:unnamed protein product [Heligmosomoides polygyrus]